MILDVQWKLEQHEPIRSGGRVFNPRPVLHLVVRVRYPGGGITYGGRYSIPHDFPAELLPVLADLLAPRVAARDATDADEVVRMMLAATSAAHGVA